MALNKNRPKEGDELYLEGKDTPHSSVKMFAGQSLTNGNWLVYDTVGMPREIRHDNSKWVIVNENQ